MNHEGQSFRNISATTAAFTLTLGGYYDVAASATWGGGNAHLQRMLPDGSTFVDVGASTNFTANGAVIVQLPPGTYKFTVTTAAAVYLSVSRVPAG